MHEFELLKEFDQFISNATKEHALLVHMEETKPDNFKLEDDDDIAE